MNASPPKTSASTKCKPKSWPYWVPVLLYAAGIFYLSSRPGSDFPFLFPYADKLIHVLLYTGFGFFVARAVSFQWARVDRFTLWFSIVITALYGLSDEYHQYFVATRSCEVWDWVMDIVGGVLGSVAYAMYNHSTLERYLALKDRMEKNP